MSNKIKKRLAVFLVLTVLVTGFIFYNSLQNSEETSAASDIIKKAMVNVYKALKENNLKSKLILSSVVAFILVGVVGGTIVTFALGIVYM